MATRYLIELGHRRIACITGPSLLNPSADRVNGYKQALSEAGIPENPAWIVTGDFQYRGGELGIEQLLQLDERPTAVFACNDMMALGALQALKDSGISVPEKCKIVGFDDITLSEICDPPITTIQQDTDMFGKKSVETLLNLIENNEIKNKNDIYVIPVKLVKRTTA